MSSQELWAKIVLTLEIFCFLQPNSTYNRDSTYNYNLTDTEIVNNGVILKKGQTVLIIEWVLIIERREYPYFAS